MRHRGALSTILLLKFSSSLKLFPNKKSLLKRNKEDVYACMLKWKALFGTLKRKHELQNIVPSMIVFILAIRIGTLTHIFILHIYLSVHMNTARQPSLYVVTHSYIQGG